MIEYTKIKKGDNLRVTGVATHGTPAKGDVVKVTNVFAAGVVVADVKDGKVSHFNGPGGADHLEAYPDQVPPAGPPVQPPPAE